MERFCVSHDCHRLGCDVEMVQSNVGEWVGYDDASAEIAKLRAQSALFDAQREAVARELAGLGVEYGTPDDYARAASVAIAKLRAEVDSLRSDLSAARAALDGERAKCDEAKWFIEYLSATNDGQRADAEAWLFGYRARRAAEAQPKDPPHA